MPQNAESSAAKEKNADLQAVDAQSPAKKEPSAVDKALEKATKAREASTESKEKDQSDEKITADNEIGVKSD